MCPSKMTVRTNNGSAAKQSLRVASSGWSAQLMKMNGNTKNITVFTNAKTQPSSFCTTSSTSDSAQPPIAGAKITHALPVRMLLRVAIWYVCKQARSRFCQTLEKQMATSSCPYPDNHVHGLGHQQHP